MPSLAVDAAPHRAARLWLPHQHGAWAMLALPDPRRDRRQPVRAGSGLLLASVAVAAYLASATPQAWLRARRRPSYAPSIVAYAAATVVLGIPLLALEPRLLLAAIVVVPAGALTLAVARPGTPRELALSLAHVAEAPCSSRPAMILAGGGQALGARAATAIGLAAPRSPGPSWSCVRSSASATTRPSRPSQPVFHAGDRASRPRPFSPGPTRLSAAFLAARAVALPVVRRRRRLASLGRPLRPVHVGLVEAVASVALVACRS